MLNHLLTLYSKTNWPFFSIRSLINEGVFNKEEADKLFYEGKITKREGMHGDLIEFINKEKWMNLVNGYQNTKDL